MSTPWLLPAAPARLPLPGGDAVRARVLDAQRAGPGHVDWYEFVPGRIDPRAPMLVTVHGISGNAREHVELYRRHADRQGVVVVAPVFGSRDFHGFQRPRRRSSPAARLLLRIVAEVRARHALADRPFALFGFSGGAQFAHRFALLDPRRVRTLIVCAAGWYTFPDPTLPYPLGVGPGPGTAPRFDLDAFLQIPVHVVVGAGDVLQDEALNAAPELCRLQGGNRVERSRRWADALRQAGRARGIATAVSHTILRGCGHSFEECVRNGGLAEFVFASLYRRP